MIQNKTKQIELLDIGSGRNPFLFSLPEAVTLDLPNIKKLKFTRKIINNPIDWANPHIEADATAGLPLGDCTVENIMMHHSVGYGAFGVINPNGLALLAAEAMRVLVYDGSLYIKSVFSMQDTKEWSLHTADFVWPLLSAGFKMCNIEFLYNDFLFEHQLALRIIEEAAAFSGADQRDNNCCFIVATKAR